MWVLEWVINQLIIASVTVYSWPTEEEEPAAARRWVVLSSSQLLLVAHYTAATKPRSVVEAGVQASYLAVAPG